MTLLLEIKNYFLRVKKASLDNLSKEFNLDIEILENMLSLWIKKGCLKKVSNEKDCASRCSSCQLGCFTAKKIPSFEVYEWVEHSHS